MMKRLVIGTRASKLAMIQTRWVAAQLQRHWPDLEICIEQIRTTGDIATQVPLINIGGDGVFVREIEHALVERRIDVAVHSLKDLPTVQPPGLSLLVAGEREDARDVLIARTAPALDATFSLLLREKKQPAIQAGKSGEGVRRREKQSGRLPEEERETLAVRIGTGSLRRTAQVRALFPQAEILPLRGNVDTRLRKLDTGEYDAIILAAAGLHRLGVPADLAARMSYLSCDQVLPAPGQGALGLELRTEPELLELLAPLNNRLNQAATSAERMFMRRLGAGCYLPVAAYASMAGDQLVLTGLVISLDGQKQVRLSQSITWTPRTRVELAEQLGIELAEQALVRGAGAIIKDLGINEEERQHV